MLSPFLKKNHFNFKMEKEINNNILSKVESFPPDTSPHPSLKKDMPLPCEKVESMFSSFFIAFLWFTMTSLTTFLNKKKTKEDKDHTVFSKEKIPGQESQKRFIGKHLSRVSPFVFDFFIFIYYNIII
ncbi:MAG: hypothetical protein N2314_07180 [Brevinematales bacterium]|nr:hypothetical protein [Brevinematales bacterium]